MLIGTGTSLFVKLPEKPSRMNHGTSRRMGLSLGLSGLAGIVTAAGMIAAVGSLGVGAAMGCAVLIVLLPPVEAAPA